MVMDINDQLIDAAKSGSFNEVKRCLSEARCDPWRKNVDGKSALMWAAGCGCKACVKLLLPVSNPLAQDNDGFSALMYAAEHGDKDCVKLLLPQSDLLAVDDDGRSALMIATISGHKACVSLLWPKSDAWSVSKGATLPDVCCHLRA